MTTPQAEARYLADHKASVRDMGYAVYNPQSLPVESLPIIYGFNNGGSRGWYQATLIAADGTPLGGHCCSDEGYMPHDLGVLEGSRPDRHEGFKKHYPEGYRMEFVSHADVPNTPGLLAAFELNKQRSPSESGSSPNEQ